MRRINISIYLQQKTYNLLKQYLLAWSFYFDFAIRIQSIAKSCSYNNVYWFSHAKGVSIFIVSFKLDWSGTFFTRSSLTYSKTNWLTAKKCSQQKVTMTLWKVNLWKIKFYVSFNSSSLKSLVKIKCLNTLNLSFKNDERVDRH